MQLSFDVYIPGASAIHRGDVRVKLLLLLAYSITLFFINTWLGLAICAAICIAVEAIARLPLKRLLKLMTPVYFILFFTLVFNSFSFDIYQGGNVYGWGNVSAGVFSGFSPVALFGTFGFVPEGFARGCYFVLRIMFLVLASLIVSFTTTSTALIDAFSSFLKPLRVVRVPVTDIAMMLSIALRFIPVTAEELSRVYAAQSSRGAPFEGGSLIQRLRAWQTVLIPLFVGLFRRADHLALAMESRCYGMGKTKTALHSVSLTVFGWSFLIAGLIVCMALSFFL